MTTAARLRPIIVGQDRSITATLTRAALSAIEPAYRVGIAARNAAFDVNLLRSKRLGRTAISVGNLTTGGTGKTPFVIYLAQYLLAAGHRPAVLLRGYNPQHRSGTNDQTAPTPASDEATLLREVLGERVPVEADADRAAAAQRMLDAYPQTDVFLLDDAFQHRWAYRDLDLVLIDATDPFSNRHVLPRGLLREPLRNLRRAHAVVITRTDEIPNAQIAELDAAITKITGHPPLTHTGHHWDGLVDHTDCEHPLDALQRTPVFAVAGIGNPDSFDRHLRSHAPRVVDSRRLPDHHPYTRDELDTFFRDAHTRHAGAIVTTHKDMVKWRPLLADTSPPLPVYYPRLSIAILDGQNQLDSLLKQTLSGH